MRRAEATRLVKQTGARVNAEVESDIEEADLPVWPTGCPT
jgi:hypothetical protein